MRLRTVTIIMISLLLFGGIGTASAATAPCGCWQDNLLQGDWKFYTNGIATWNWEYTYSQIDIQKVGTNQQFYTTGFTLEPNTTYELHFQAINNLPRIEKMSVVVLQNGAPYTRFFHADAVLPTFVGTEPTHYTYRFKTPAKISGDMRFMYYFDHSKAGDQFILMSWPSLKKVWS